MTDGVSVRFGSCVESNRAATILVVASASRAVQADSLNV